MANHGQDLDDFNARVLSELGQRRPPRPVQRRVGWFPVVLVLGGIFVGIPVAGRALDQLADKRHPERVAIREAAATRAEQEALQARAQEARAEAARAAEKDEALEREVRAEVLNRQMVVTRAAIEAELREPGSATFRNVIAIDDGMAFCGEVNGANAFGGYAGWTTFISIGGSVSFAPTKAGPMANLFEASFDKWCRRGGKKAAVEL